WSRLQRSNDGLGPAASSGVAFESRVSQPLVMRALRHVLLPLLLCFPACSRSSDGARNPEEEARAAVPRIAGMPDPLPLPTEPPAGVLHLREPLTLAHVA